MHTEKINVAKSSREKATAPRVRVAIFSSYWEQGGGVTGISSLLLASAPNRLRSPEQAYVGAHSGSHHETPSVLLAPSFGEIFAFFTYVVWGFCLVMVVALFVCVFFLSAFICLGRLVKFRRDKVQYLGTKPQKHHLYFQNFMKNGFAIYIGNLLTF